ncbi:MBL fold metallo-hydrolase [Dyella choica]|uniref:MBL fold metallo-hydrolase n=1 Tax=Dyella choica TaxID=1927959 RepID=A0A432M7Z8_9GAMM|nr:MBL fold metallo-hydrolase [Dyella choica]RUL77653.1 MBL fold metallo-hydrolase [Dyella choica]
MTAPEVKAFFDASSNTFSYVVWDPATREAAIIDSVLDFDPASGRTGHVSADAIVAFVQAMRLSLVWLIETHVHADHLSAAPYLQARLGGKVAIGEHIAAVQDVFGELFHAGAAFRRDGSQFDHLFKDGEHYHLGSIEAVALYTPGHTPACMTHVIGDAAFVGDTLFMPDYGSARCDFPGGDAAVLYRSSRKLFELPDDTRVFLCHDYKPPGREDYGYATTMGEQKRNNIHLRQGVSEEEFVRLRTERDARLAVPRLLLPSVQVNMWAGHLPAAEENGIRYLKLPLDAL